jgi:UDP-N-acetylmuramoylalanine--D-glutamate ligase
MALMPDIAGRRVLVWGFGRHGGGLAAGLHVESRGAVVEVLDSRPAKDLGADADLARARGWRWHVGDASHPVFRRVDAVIPSPAIPPRAWPIDAPPAWSPEWLFFSAHRGPRVAVTGTKGKSTTSTILGRLLGWPVAGNSHEPLLAALGRLGADTPMVCELSSFQLWYLRQSRPQFAAAAMPSLAVDHLDWHPSVEHYHATKLALLGWCQACAVADEVAPLLAAVAVPDVRLLPRFTCDNGWFCDSQGVAVAARTDLDLLGDHNARNAGLALAVARHLGVEDDDLAPRLRLVTALPHRLQLVHEVSSPARADRRATATGRRETATDRRATDGGQGQPLRWRFVNDSIATTPESTMAALTSIQGALAVILGGSDKGAQFAGLARAVAARGAHPVLIGQTGPALAAALAEVGIATGIMPSLELAVARAVELLPGGGTVLLSPSCASLDQFRSFEDRGDRFTAAARRVVV